MQNENTPSAARLRDLTWREFRVLVPGRCDGVVIPVGTLEAHGGIPLGTDIIIPEYLAERLAANFQLLLAPAVNYGVTRTLLPYPGSHTVSSATFRQYVTEVFNGFGRMGFRRLVVVNGHGGHLNELREAVQVAYRETGIFSVVLHWWLMAPEASVEVYGAEGGHAAVEETAAVMVAAPELFEPAAIEDLKGAAFNAGVFAYPLPRAVGVKEEGKGLPDADPAKAAAFMAKIVDKCITVLEETFAGWREELGQS